MSISIRLSFLFAFFLISFIVLPQRTVALTSVAPTVPPGCYYKQVQCIKAPCNPILVCPSGFPTAKPTEVPTKVPQYTQPPAADCTLGPKGDANCNDVIDSDDYVIWKAAYVEKKIDSPNNPDFNRDSKITLIDLEIWVRHIGETVGNKPSSTIAPSLAVTAKPAITITPLPQPTDIPEPTDLVVSSTPGPSPTLQPVSGITYYIAPNGSDGADGKSISTPFKTFDFALPKLKPGDILYAREGNYPEKVDVSLNAGGPNAKIVVKNYPNERPVISGLFWVHNPTYWVFDGINVTWNSSIGGAGDHMVKFTDKGEFWELKNCEIWGAHSFAGISVTGFTKNWSINNCLIHDTYKSNDTNQDHLIYVNDSSYGTIERNIFVGSVNGRGVKLGPPSGGGAGPNHIIVRYNTFYDNTGPANIQVSGGTSDNLFMKNILVKPSEGSTNITVNSGYFGTNSVAKDNLGWQSKGVFESGIVDGGGNITNIDPQIQFNVPKRADGSYNIDTTSFKPANATAQNYGKFAQ